MHRKISIIGSNSFLAGWLQKELTGPATEFQLWGRRLLADWANVSFQVYDFPYRPLDYRRIAEADVVIYTAAAGVQANNSLSEASIAELNAFEPIRLALHLKELNFTGQLFTFGSYFEIGAATGQEHFTEEAVVFARFAAVTPYIRAKRLLTRFFFDFSAPFTFQHLLLPTIYGPGENPNRLIPSLLTAGKNNQAVKLTGGNQIRQYLYVNDLCRLIQDLLRQPVPSGIYNVSCQDELRVSELVEQVKQAVPFPIHTEFGTLARTDTAMPCLLLDDAKLRRVTSWRPGTPVAQAVKHYLSAPEALLPGSHLPS